MGAVHRVGVAVRGAAALTPPRGGRLAALTFAALVAFAANSVLARLALRGGLTDAVITRAIEAGAAVVVLPCCHDVANSDRGGLEGWLEPSLAIDVTRAARLRAAGYEVRTQTLPETITAKNRLLLATPAPPADPARSR